MANLLAKFMEVDRSYGMWTVKAYLTLLSNIFSFAGAIFLIRSTLRLTPEIMSKLGGTYFSFNTFQLHALIEQKADTTCGFWLIALGFLLGIISMLFKEELMPNFHQIVAITSLWVYGAGIIGVAWAVDRNLVVRNERAVAKIFIGQSVDETVKRGHVLKSDMEHVRFVASEFTNLMNDQADRAMFVEAARFSGRQLPSNLEFEGQERN